MAFLAARSGSSHAARLTTMPKRSAAKMSETATLIRDAAGSASPESSPGSSSVPTRWSIAIAPTVRADTGHTDPRLPRHRTHFDTFLRRRLQAYAPGWLSQRSAQQAPGDYSAGRDQPGDHSVGDSRRIELPAVGEETREAHGRDQTPPPEGEANEEAPADKHHHVQRHVRSHTKSLTEHHPDGDPRRR